MLKKIYPVLILLTIFPFSIAARQGNPNSPVNVIAYYSGNAEGIDAYKVEQLTHIIYSFCHLKGNRLHVDDAKDSLTIKKLVSLKKKNSSLKVMLSLGGWGGCKSCSDVFSTAKGIKEFAVSVKELNNYFGTDGIDLDWEYPAIEGVPGHPYRPEDKPNFTALLKALRKELGVKNEISFAAGGFTKFLKESIEWNKVAPLIDRVNLMSYDLISGYSTTTGHHTPLYSNQQQKESADNAINYLEQTGFPVNKIVIGAAFYARTWEGVDTGNRGLYQSGKFQKFLPYKHFTTGLSPDSGFVFFRDDMAKAPWAYHSQSKIFATFDDEVSIQNKTAYVLEKGLNGIMFWELTLDKPEDGLLAIIHKTLHKTIPVRK